MNRNDVTNELNRIYETNKTQKRCNENEKFKKKDDKAIDTKKKRTAANKTTSTDKKKDISLQTNDTKVTKRKVTAPLDEKSGDRVTRTLRSRCNGPASGSSNTDQSDQKTLDMTQAAGSKRKRDNTKKTASIPEKQEKKVKRKIN